MQYYLLESLVEQDHRHPWIGYFCIEQHQKADHHHRITVMWISDATGEIKITTGGSFEGYLARDLIYRMEEIDLATFLRAFNIWSLKNT